MMEVLYIIAIIGCLLCLISLLRIRIVIMYTQDIAIELHILFFRFKLYPQRKKVKIKQYEYKQYRKRLLTKQKKIAEKPKKAKDVEHKRVSKRPMQETMRIYTYLFKKLYMRFLHHFRIDIAKLHIVVATGDAAQTAITTGIVSQAVTYILEILKNHTNTHYRYHADVCIAPDYLAEKSRISCKLLFSIRLFEIIDLGIRFFYHFLIQKTKQTASK